MLQRIALFFLVFAQLATLALGAAVLPIPNSSPCRGEFIWPAVTPRTTDEVMDHIWPLDRTLVVLANGQLQPFERKSIIEKQQSLLSLGEGRSHFVWDFMTESELRLGTSGQFFAVDIQYEPSPLQEEASRKFLEAAPHRDHYIGQSFGQLDLTHADGSRMQFDHIVSVHALGYVLDRSTPEDSIRILDRVIDHLASGGTLRVTPMSFANWRETLQPHLEALKQAGLISFYTRAVGGGSGSGIAVIR